jgi:hypothetical protein
MSDKTPQQGAQSAEPKPARPDELTEETLESVSGGVIDGPGGCIPPCKPPYPDWPGPIVTDPTMLG